MLESLQLPKRQYPCVIRDTAATMTEKDQKHFFDAVDNPEWPLATLERELHKLGVVVSQSSIKKHRIKTCSCYR